MGTLLASCDPSDFHPGVSNGCTALMHELLFRAADRRPGHEAVVYDEESLTYGELAGQAGKVAKALIASGIRRQDRVAIFLEKRIETVVSIFGIAAAGAVFVPINPALRPRQVAYILANCNVRMLITSKLRFAELSEALHECPDLSFVTLVDDSAEAVPPPFKARSWKSFLDLGDDRAYQPHAVSDSDMVAILYTSGSTGNPKGVVLTHRNVVAGAASVATYLRYNDSDRILNLPPYSFDFGLNQLLSSVYAGTTAILHNYIHPDGLMKALVDQRVTGLSGVPTVMIQLAQMQWPDRAVSTLRYLSTTGGRMPETAVRALRAALPESDLYLMYGLTESFRSTFLPPSEVDRRPNSIGKAIPNAEVLVVRPDGTTCDPYEHGELVHRGILVSLGYWNDPQKTAERFRPAPGVPADDPSSELAVWSGDTVYRDEDGFIYYVGRRDEMIKTSGYRVSPTEIEEVIYRSGLVDMSAAVGIDHPTLGQVIIVFATPKDGRSLRTGDLFAFVRDNLPAYMMPQQIISREILPLNSNGKVDRKSLAAEYAENADGNGQTWSAPKPKPSSWRHVLLEQAVDLLGLRKKSFTSIAEIFEWTFNKARVDRNQTFAALGGDSLSFVACSTALQEYLGTLPDNWEHLSVDQLESLSRTATEKIELRPDILLRAIAILAVVAQHNGFTRLEGATALLFLLSGFSFARFNWNESPNQVRSSVIGTIGKLLIPVLLMIGAFSFINGRIHWPTLLFYNNLVSPYLLPWWIGSWFIQGLFQIFLLMALLASIPNVTTFGFKHPFAFALLLVAGALALNFGLAWTLSPSINELPFLPQYFLWQFALGFMLVAARSQWRRLAMMAVLVAALGASYAVANLTGDKNLVDSSGSRWLLFGTALLLWMPPLPLPRLLALPILVIAKASLFIYIFHLSLIWQLMDVKGYLGVAISLGESIVLWLVYESVARTIASLVQPRALMSKFASEIASLLGIRRKSFGTISEIFEWTFNRAHIGGDHTFASLGGDSLSFVACSTALQEYLGHLPDNWERTKIDDLEKLGRTATNTIALRPDILLRAVAILAVIGSHNGYTSLNGAPGLLFIVSGLSFFRFTWDSEPGRVWLSVVGMISKLLVPMLLFMSIFFIADNRVAWPMVFFVQNIIGDGQLSWWMGAWFVQVLFQIFVFMAVLASVPGVAKFGMRHPFSFGIALVGGGLVLNFAVASIVGPSIQIYSQLPQYYLWQFALGGLILASRTFPMRLFSLATAAAAIGVLALTQGMTGDPTLTEGPARWILGGTVLLLWLPTIALPRLLATPILVVARASLFIYLFHWRVEQIGMSLWHIHGGIPGSLIGLAGAVLIWAIYEATLKAIGPGIQAPRAVMAASEA